jgi:hypothetical protein
LNEPVTHSDGESDWQDEDMDDGPGSFEHHGEEEVGKKIVNVEGGSAA